MWGKKMGKWLAEDTTALLKGLFDFLDTKHALWKDIRFTAKRHLRYAILSEGKYTTTTTTTTTNIL